MFLIIAALIIIPLYPKFPLVGVSGTYVAVRLEDFLVAGMLAVTVLVNIKSRFRDIDSGLSRAILLYLAAGAVAVFSAIFLTKTADLNLGLLHFFRRIEYFGLFFAAYSALKNPDKLTFVVKSLLAVSLLVAVYGLGQMFFSFPVISTTNSEFSKGLALSLGPGARINSTFAGHYDLAAFTVFPLLLVIALLPFSRHRLPLLVIWAMSYSTLLLSASRITFASFLLSAAALVLVIRKPLWLVPLGLMAVMGVVVSPQLRGRYLDFITNHVRLSYVSTVSAQTDNKDVNATPDALKPPAVAEDRSFNIRLQVEWPRAIRSFAVNPVWGTGFSSVGLAVDNDYLRTLAETGALGLTAFLMIFWRFFRRIAAPLIAYRQDVPHAFIATVACFVFSLLAAAVFIDVFAASKIAIFTWIVVGLAAKAASSPSLKRT